MIYILKSRTANEKLPYGMLPQRQLHGPPRVACQLRQAHVACHLSTTRWHTTKVNDREFKPPTFCMPMKSSNQPTMLSHLCESKVVFLISRSG